MPKNSCIMQIRAEPKKTALPICNYSQILYQFLSFTQKLKRSLQTSTWISHLDSPRKCPHPRLVKHDWFFGSAVPHNVPISHYMIESSAPIKGIDQLKLTFRKLKHYFPLLSCYLRLSDAVTDIIPRLAIICLVNPWINQNPTSSA